MADRSLIADAAADDDDARLLTDLADRLTARIPMLCVLKTFYDGRERIPTKAIPKSVNQKGYAVYQRFVSLCSMDFAKAIADAVIHRQRPSGFRLIADKTMRSTAADDEWANTRMELKSRQMFHDAAIYGAAYAMVDGVDANNRVKVLSPWTTVVSDDEDSAIVYGYDLHEGAEYITLYRLERNPDGSVAELKVKTAINKTDSHSLLFDSDAEAIYDLANDDSKNAPKLPETFEWAESSKSDFEFAVDCGMLPVVRFAAPGGMGQFEPHVSALTGLDQQRFQRFCIQELQAFKQRGVSIDKLQQYYKESDPQVRDGSHKAGEKIDYSELFEQGPDALWIIPGDAKFWESGTTDITGIVNACAADVKQLAASSGTPLDILSPDVAGSAEGATLKREGLVFKVDDMNARANDAFVRIMRMAMYADGNENAVDDRFETVWKPVNPPSLLEQAQAFNFCAGDNGLPLKTNMRRNLGMTEIEIAEALQDATDTVFANAIAYQKALSAGVEQQSEVQPQPTPPSTVSEAESESGETSLDDSEIGEFV